MTRRVTQVKLGTGGSITIHWQETAAHGEGWNTYALRCREEARPSFHKAMQAFGLYVLGICELPESWGDGLSVLGVKWLFDDLDDLGVVVTAKRTLEASSRALVIRTPAAYNAPKDPAGRDQLPAAALDMLDDLEREALAYIRGDRQQQSLFDESEEDESEVMAV